MDKPDDDRRPFALVADDDLMILMDAMDILDDAGFRPLEAHSVDEAEALLSEYADEVTLLFTDVEMGGERNGFDLALLTAERWPDISIVVASGGVKPGPDQMPKTAVFLSKPFSADVIYDCLQELLPDGKKPEPLKAKVRAH